MDAHPGLEFFFLYINLYVHKSPIYKAVKYFASLFVFGESSSLNVYILL